MKMHELIGSPDNWVTGYVAINTENKVCSPTHPSAVRWDIEGAIFKCYPSMDERKLVETKIFRSICKRTNKVDSIATFNDLAKHDEIIKILKELDV